jgi:hypothetical protein
MLRAPRRSEEGSAATPPVGDDRLHQNLALALLTVVLLPPACWPERSIWREECSSTSFRYWR